MRQPNPTAAAPKPLTPFQSMILATAASLAAREIYPSVGAMYEALKDQLPGPRLNVTGRIASTRNVLVMREVWPCPLLPDRARPEEMARAIKAFVRVKAPTRVRLGPFAGDMVRVAKLVRSQRKLIEMSPRFGPGVEGPLSSRNPKPARRSRGNNFLFPSRRPSP